MDALVWIFFIIFDITVMYFVWYLANMAMGKK